MSVHRCTQRGRDRPGPCAEVSTFGEAGQKIGRNSLFDFCNFSVSLRFFKRKFKNTRLCASVCICAHVPACMRSSVAPCLRTQALEPGVLGPNPGCTTCELCHFLPKQPEPE